MRREPHTSISKAKIAAGVLSIVLVAVLAFVAGIRLLQQPFEQNDEPDAVTSAGTTLPAAVATPKAVSESPQGFIFGRVTANDGASYVGRLRFGGDEEAFWGDYFNGFKNKNPWAGHATSKQLKERRPLEIFGFEVFHWESQIDLARPFMARFGDIARIEPNGRDLQVTLKSGTIVHLDLFAADDFADGVRIWDGEGGSADFEEAQIRTIDFLPTGQIDFAPTRLHGIVHTQRGDFTGFIQWNRQKGVGSDELKGRTANGEDSLPFEAIRSIARNSLKSALVTLFDGEAIVLSDTPEVGPGNRGIYVDDRRYGRLLISWDAFERVDFSPGGSGPAYADFPTGRPLMGSVTLRDGRRLAGRLVYDLDESETTETLDAPSQGIDYTIPFGLIASIMLPAPEERSAGRAIVALHRGEALQMDLAGDLGGGNGGMLIFVAGRGKEPEYVRWTEIAQIQFDRPPAMHPSLEER